MAGGEEKWHAFVAELEAQRQTAEFPPLIRHRAERFTRRTLAFLFPHFQEPGHEDHTLQQEFDHVLDQLRAGLGGLHQQDQQLIVGFTDALPDVYRLIKLDAEAIFRSDPAAESLDEVIVSYPGFFAIAVYRIAHIFYELKLPIFPRLIAEYGHRVTGIDIHPGAKIGESFSIDHGTGIVIGETTEIGRNVRIFQGVTLGALSVEKSLSGAKRHPTLEDNVVVYASATILGGNTVVGEGSIIGGNVWLTHSVPAGSIITSTSRRRSSLEDDLEFHI